MSETLFQVIPVRHLPVSQQVLGGWTAASTVVLDNSRVLSVVCLLCIDLFVTGENC